MSGHAFRRQAAVALDDGPPVDRSTAVQHGITAASKQESARPMTFECGSHQGSLLVTLPFPPLLHSLSRWGLGALLSAVTQSDSLTATIATAAKTATGALGQAGGQAGQATAVSD